MDRNTLTGLIASFAHLDETDLPRWAIEIHSRWFHRRLALWAARSSVSISFGVARKYDELPEKVCLDPLVTYLLRSTRTPGADEWTRLDSEIERILHGGEDDAEALSAPGDLTGGRILLVGDGEYLKLAWIYEGFQACASYRTDEMKEATSTLRSAVDALTLSGDAANSLVFSALRVVALGKDLDLPTALGSMSSKRSIGLTGIANILQAPWSSLRLAGTLIHEAIHSVLYRLELEHAFYTDPGKAADVRITSPWTKRSLALHSFVHATFVWTGMFHFYLRLRSRGVECDDLLSECWRGFEEYGEPQLAESGTFQSIMPDVFSAMLACVRRARESGHQFGFV